MYLCFFYSAPSFWDSCMLTWLKMLAPWKKSYDKPRQCIKKQRHHFANKGLYSQSYGFSSSHIWMWELDHKEGWVPKNWYLLTVVLEKTPESPSDCKESQPVTSKGNQSWIFIRRTGAEVRLQFFDHLLWRTNSWEKMLMLGKLKARGEVDNRGQHGWMASPTQWTWVWASSGR